MDLSSSTSSSPSSPAVVVVAEEQDVPATADQKSLAAAEVQPPVAPESQLVAEQEAAVRHLPTPEEVSLPPAQVTEPLPPPSLQPSQDLVTEQQRKERKQTAQKQVDQKPRSSFLQRISSLASPVKKRTEGPKKVEIVTEQPEETNDAKEGTNDLRDGQQSPISPLDAKVDANDRPPLPVVTQDGDQLEDVGAAIEIPPTQATTEIGNVPTTGEDAAPPKTDDESESQQRASDLMNHPAVTHASRVMGHVHKFILKTGNAIKTKLDEIDETMHNDDSDDELFDEEYDEVTEEEAKEELLGGGSSSHHHVKQAAPRIEGTTAAGGGDASSRNESANGRAKAPQTSTGKLMAENLNQLNERGEKLDQLGGQMEHLNEASNNFLAMAQRLADEQAKRKWWQF